MFEEKRERLRKVFLGETDYVPLGVNVKSEPSPYTLSDRMKNPKLELLHAKNIFKNTIKVDSDIVPFVESNFLETLIPSIFGAEIHEAPCGVIDVRPIFKDIYETADINIDDIFIGEMEKSIRHLEYIRDNAPDDMYVTTTRVMSPLDAAVVMRGGDFYMDLLLEPELSKEFMNKIACVTIKVLKEHKKIINQPLNETVTPRGFIFPGVRLTGDAIVNVSRQMVEETFCPYYKMFEKEFDKVMLHYCCTPAPSTHVIGGLINGGGVIFADNWQGYKTMVGDNIFIKGMGICTDVNKDDILSGNLFEDPFFKFRERPLTVSVTADTIDEGKKLYDIWQEKMNK